MNRLKHFLLLLLLACPLKSLAHGQDALVTVFLEFYVVVVLVIGLLAIKFNGKGKLIIGGICIFGTVLTFMIINSLPYNQYQEMINIVVVVLPLTIGVISYLGLKNKFQKK